MFRRRSAAAPDARAAGPDGTAASPPVNGRPAPASGLPGGAGKGRPTPKRSEAEKRRRQPFTGAPADRKAASGRSRSPDRAERAKRMQAMRRGEEWAMPPRDRGPVRALVRNYVDSRRTFSEFYLIGAFAVLLVLFIPALKQRQIVDYLVLAILVGLVAETSYHGYKMRRLVNERFPSENTKGLRLYMAKRMVALRSARIPGPVVKPGDKI